MKNTKKILMILCSLAVLFATMFSVAVTAIDAVSAGGNSSSVLAGQGTSVTEYATMKIGANHGFENGKTVLFSNTKLPNDNYIPKNSNIYTQNNGVRLAATPIYGNADSVKYFVINYDTNEKANHWYIEPILGDLDNPEKTPVNGFIAEFDLSFLSAVEVLMEQKVDENGELMWETLTDANGNVIYAQATDDKGEPMWETNEDGSQKLDDNGEPIPVRIPIMQEVQEPLLSDEPELDEYGNIVYEIDYYVNVLDANGNQIYDEDADGSLIARKEPVYKTDSEGRPLVKYKPVVDENGEMVMTSKVAMKDWVGPNVEFEIAMNNDYTNDHGSISLMKFETVAETKTMRLKTITGNLLDKQPAFSAQSDEWVHIAVQYDAKTLLTYIYIGRDDSEFDTDGDGVTDVYGRLLVGIRKATAMHKEYGEMVNVYPLRFRMGCKATQGVVGFDNFISYQGTTIHDPTLLNEKVSYEKYLYLADILENVTEYKTVKDADGNTVYQVITDENGEELYLPVYEMITDENGNLVYATDENGNKVPTYQKDENGEYVLDNDGNKIPVYVQMYEYAKDENGNVIYEKAKDEKGNPVYAVKTDENGNVLYELEKDTDGNVVYKYATDVDGKTVLYLIKKDANGNPMYEKNDDGSIKLESANGYMRKVPVYELDEKGNKIPLYELDENGNKIPLYKTDGKGNKIPVYELDTNGNKIECYATDENGDMIPVYATDADGNKIPYYENGMPVYEKLYLLDTLGNRVPVYELDENGNKIVIKEGETSVNRYQAFNLLATNDELRRVYSGENLGGDPTLEEMQALEHAIAVYEAYANDKKNGAVSSDTLVSCYSDMLAAAKLENAAMYLWYAEDAMNTERTLANYADRAAKVAKATEFYNSVGSVIERDSNGDYGKAVAILDVLGAVVKSDEAAYNFVNAVNIFNNSVAYGATASRIKSHYENAKYYYPSISSDYNDPDTTLDAESVEKIQNAVASFLSAEGITNDTAKEYNSARFVGLVNMMQKKSTGSWAHDGEEVEALWLRALEIILEGNYDAGGDEFVTAKVLFDSANEYFWEKMQQNHIEIISSKLDSYNDPDMTYIDRAGICTYVDRYIELNAKYLDLDRIEISREITRNTAYKVQLDTLVGDYKKLLKENSPKFISVMKMSKLYSSYADLKPLYDEATKYYYTMNIEGDGIEECLADYEELRALVSTIERDSQAYIDIIYGNVKDENGDAIFNPMSQITDQSELYVSLREAYLCMENLDITYPGAAEAKAIYEAKYQEYNASIVTVNAELSNGEAVVYATRGNWSYDVLVVFTKNLINKKG